MYSSLFFGSYTTDASKLACLVAGYGGKIKSYHKAVEALRSAGYDVIAFEFSRSVLENGNPDDLLGLITKISKEAEDIGSRYQEILCCGVSLGAYIAFNIQRRIRKAKSGMYGTAGISVSHAIFTARIFSRVRKEFISSGYDEIALRNKWESIEILEDAGIDRSKSLVIVMGRLDRIVKYRTASKIMECWVSQGTRVRYFGLKNRVHAQTISWYKNNLSKLLLFSSSKSFNAQP